MSTFLAVRSGWTTSVSMTGRTVGLGSGKYLFSIDPVMGRVVFCGIIELSRTAFELIGFPVRLYTCLRFSLLCISEPLTPLISLTVEFTPDLLDGFERLQPSPHHRS